MQLKQTGTQWNRDTRNDINDNWNKITNNFNNAVQKTIDEAKPQIIDELVDEAKLTWVPAVENYADIDITYPNPEEGWTVNVSSEGNVYRYDGTDWVQIQSIDPGPYNELSSQLEQKANQFEFDELKETVDEINPRSGVLEKMVSPVDAPDGFNWSDPPINIYKNRKGQISTDFNVSDYEIKGKTYFVDVKNGDNDNDGLTLGTAFQSIWRAYEQSDVKEIHIAEGLYSRSNGFREPAVGGEHGIIEWEIEKDISLKAIEGHYVQIGAFDPLIWDLEDGFSNVYHTVKSELTIIVDTTKHQKNGDFYEYEEVGSLSEVENNPGTYHRDGVDCYLHTFYSDEPTNENAMIYVPRDILHASDDSINVYCEGIHFCGQVIVDESVFYAKNCKFSYSHLEGLDINGSDYVFLQKCEAYKNYEDGFNYHVLNGIVYMIEVDCTGRDNGYNNDATNQYHNGSTLHGGCKGIRINGGYHDNKGGNVADVGSGTHSWNLGCIAHKSTADVGTSQRGNFYLGTDNSKMWLDSCGSYDTDDASLVVNHEDSIMYLRNVVSDGDNIELGSIINY